MNFPYFNSGTCIKQKGKELPTWENVVQTALHFKKQYTLQDCNISYFVHMIEKSFISFRYLHTISREQSTCKYNHKSYRKLMTLRWHYIHHNTCTISKPLISFQIIKIPSMQIHVFWHVSVTFCLKKYMLIDEDLLDVSFS